MLKAINLRCEYLKNPIGIGERKPRFSWQIESDVKNVIQKSYHLQVAADPGFTKMLWDTGEVCSSESVHIKYEGPDLQSCQRYYFRAAVTDNHGQNSNWSDTAFFETAMFDVSEWKADFIASSDTDKRKKSNGILLRNEFNINKKVAEARLYATALGLYEMFINGAKVGDAVFTPGWTEYKSRLQYQTYDVTGLLTEGKNAIGAILGGGWYIGNVYGWLGRQVNYGERKALLAQMLIRYEDGTEQYVLTDESWKTIDGPIVFSEFYNGEIYDARLEKTGWNQPGYDDSGWANACVLEQDKGILTPQDGLYVRRQEELKPLSMFVTPKGEKVIDFGQNLAGWVKFSVKGKAGDKVILKHAEVLDKDGNFYTENLREAKACIEYTLKGDGVETFEPHFTYQGYRYVQVVEYPGEPKPDNFTAVVVHSDMEPTGHFASSSEMLNKLQHNILWGLKGNFIDVPTDCPQRDERLGWTGDAQIFIRTACFLMDTQPFFKKWLRDMKVAQLENGGMPFVIPDVLTSRPGDIEIESFGHSTCGWGDASTICPWTVYMTYGDKDILEELYGTMKKWVEYIRARAENETIWNTDFHYGDWVALDAPAGSRTGATSTDFLATAYYAYSTDILAKSAAVLGKKDDYEEYSGLHARILDAFKDEFYTPAGRLAVDTQTAHVIALAFGLAPEEYRSRTINDLARLIDKSNGSLTTGFLGTPYLCHALSENGRLDLAYMLLMREEYPSWLYPITKGATTIWEHWDSIKPDGSMWSAEMNSFNHYAYGAVGDFLYRVVAGLQTDPNAPGYKRMFIHPKPGGGLTFAEAEIMSVYGKASVKWEIKDGSMNINVAIPHNTTAHIILPGAKSNEVKSCCSNIEFADCPGGAEAELGSGEYSFVYPYIV